MLGAKHITKTIPWEDWNAGFWTPITVLTTLLMMFPSLVVSVWGQPGQLVHIVCPIPPVSNTSCNLSTPHLLIHTWIHTSRAFKIQKTFLYSDKLLTNLSISSIIFRIFIKYQLCAKFRGKAMRLKKWLW